MAVPRSAERVAHRMQDVLHSTLKLKYQVRPSNAHARGMYKCEIEGADARSPQPTVPVHRSAAMQQEATGVHSCHIHYAYPRKY